MQRRALGLLFSGLAVAMVATAVEALIGAHREARGWVVAFAALVVAGWLAVLAWGALRRRG